MKNEERNSNKLLLAGSAAAIDNKQKQTMNFDCDNISIISSKPRANRKKFVKNLNFEIKQKNSKKKENSIKLSALFSNKIFIHKKFTFFFLLSFSSKNCFAQKYLFFAKENPKNKFHTLNFNFRSWLEKILNCSSFSRRPENTENCFVLLRSASYYTFFFGSSRLSTRYFFVVSFPTNFTYAMESERYLSDTFCNENSVEKKMYLENTFVLISECIYSS